MVMLQHQHESDDLQEILRRAVHIEATKTDTRDQLLKAAEELGVSAESLAEAESTYYREKAERAEMDQFMSERKGAFISHLGIYLIVNAMLACIWAVTRDAGDGFWPIYTLLGWGIGVGIHALATFNKKDPDFQKEFREWQEKRRGKTTESLPS